MVTVLFNENKSAAIFQNQVVAWVREMFCFFSLVKNPRNVNKLTTIEAREKMKTVLESLEFYLFFAFTKSKNNQLLKDLRADTDKWTVQCLFI